MGSSSFRAIALVVLASLIVVAHLAGAEITSVNLAEVTNADGSTRELTEKEIAERKQRIAAEIQARRELRRRQLDAAGATVETPPPPSAVTPPQSAAEKDMVDRMNRVAEEIQARRIAARQQREAAGTSPSPPSAVAQPAPARRVNLYDVSVTLAVETLAQRAGVQFVNQSRHGDAQISFGCPAYIPAPQIDEAFTELLRLRGFALTRTATTWTLADAPDASAEMSTALREKPIGKRLPATLQSLSESEVFETSMKDMELHSFLQFFGQICGREILADNSFPALLFSQAYTKTNRREAAAQFDAALVARRIYSYEFGEHFIVVCYVPAK